MIPFTTARADGRPDWKVVFDLVNGATPGTLFRYQELETALLTGLDTTEIHPNRIYRACHIASDHLLVEHDRALRCLRGVGYEIAHARDHITMANEHRHKSHRQLDMALAKTANVRLEELTTAERSLIEQMRIIFGGFAQMLAASERRQDRFERVLDEIRKQQLDMTARIDRIDPPTALSDPPGELEA